MLCKRDRSKALGRALLFPTSADLFLLCAVTRCFVYLDMDM